MNVQHDKANLTDLRTVTVYTGAGIPRVFRVENLPLLKLVETADGGLCIYALSGEGSPSLMTRFAPGKWESFDLEYLPTEKRTPPKAVEKKQVAPPVVVQDLETAPIVRAETFTGKPHDVTQPLPVARVRSAASPTAPLQETQSFPVVSVGGDAPFSPTGLPVPFREFPFTQQQNEEARDVLRSRLDRMGKGRAASSGDSGSRS